MWQEFESGPGLTAHIQIRMLASQMDHDQDHGDKDEDGKYRGPAIFQDGGEITLQRDSERAHFIIIHTARSIIIGGCLQLNP